MKLKRLLKLFESPDKMVYMRCDETPEGMTLRLYQGRFWVENAWAFNHSAEYALTTPEVLSKSWVIVMQDKVYSNGGDGGDPMRDAVEIPIITLPDYKPEMDHHKLYDIAH